MQMFVPPPPFPANPVVGQQWCGWVWNGSTWVQGSPGGMTIAVQVFTASGTYMPSPGLSSVTVECIGGGGGGGGAANPQGVTQYVLSGGGGGSGGYSRKTLPSTLVLGGVIVTIGQGGLGANNQTGQPGGATAFGALCVANGGGGGLNCDASTGSGQGGNEALAGVGDVAFPGSCGLNGQFMDLASGAWFSASGALGGWIYGGNAASGSVPSSAGRNGEQGWNGTGAGGQGAVMNQLAAGSFAGGQGASGICIVTEYCWASSGDCGGGCAPIPITDGSCLGWGR